LKFVLCPDGYVSIGGCYGCTVTADGYSNTCYGKREGWMCGRCASGYSETLFSTKCKKSEDCNDTWFWLMFLAFVFVMASFLIFKPPIFTFAARQAFWFKYQCRTQNQENVVGETEPAAQRQAEGSESTFVLSTDEIETENLQAGGFLEIIFYFYQISSLLTSTSFDQKVRIFFRGFFNFQATFFAQDNQVCPFPGLTPATKQLFEVAPVLGTLGAIYFIYGVHLLISKILHSSRPKLRRYLGATMETILLGYIKIANVSLSLIRCVSVGDEDRWFYNGTIVCYQWWQNVSIAFVVTVVVPFIVVLAWGAVKLHRGKVSAKHFLLACVFPLPFLFWWLLQLLGVCGSRHQHADNTEYTKALKDVLLAPFREPTVKGSGALYWQSIFILRRFVLVFLYCFITDPKLRLLYMGIVCILVLVHHSSMKPFRNNRANAAETVSLLALVLLANVNSYGSIYANTQEEEINNDTWLRGALYWVQFILLTSLPAMFALMVVFVVLSLIARLIFVVCAGIYGGIQKVLRRSDERAPLLSN
jgi:hypothetical protein